MVRAEVLVAAVFERLGVKPDRPGRTGDADVAVRLGVSGGTPSQRVKRWRTGYNEPDYEWTVRLLDAAGLITDQGREVLDLGDRPRSPEAQGDRGAVDAARSLAEAASERLRRPTRDARRRGKG